MVEICFSVALFEVKNTLGPDQFHYENSANLIWGNIWNKFLVRDRSNLKWISKAIVDTIRFYYDDIRHLIKINKWIQEQLWTEDELCRSCIASGLLEGLFTVISYIRRSNLFTENLLDFFMTIKLLLGQYKRDDLPNSKQLIDFMINENYLTDPECSDLCLTCLIHILKFPNEWNYKKFGLLLAQQVIPEMKIKLLNALQSIIKESVNKKNCQESFIKAKILGTLKEVLLKFDTTLPEIITMWVSVLECVRFLIEDNPTCKKFLQDFDFGEIANVIRSEKYSLIRTEIYLKSIESVLYILFEINNLGSPQMRQVRTPEVIPLVVELLSDCGMINGAEEYFKHIEICLEDSYNASHFANSRTTDLLLDAFERGNNQYLLDFITNTLPIIICHHITPQELRKILEISAKYSKNQEKQIILLRCLANGVKNSCCSTEHYKFQANHTCLSPTRYFCFRSKRSLLKCEVSGTENLIPNKDFSVFFWVYPDDLNKNSVILIFSGYHNASLMVSLISGNIVVEYFQDKMIFAVVGNQKLNEKQWNLVGITFKSLSGILFKNDRGEVEIYIDSNKIETNIGGKVIRPKETFSKICIGNTENFGNPFVGRIIAFYICKKLLTLNHFREIFFLSFQYNLGFNPEAISTCEEISADKSTLKVIFESITFEWHPRSKYPEILGIDPIEIIDECERFNGVTIIESIAANGGLKIFLPLIKDCADRQRDREGVIILLNLIADVCIAQSVEMILDEDFFNLLKFILEGSIKRPDVQLVDALINIVGHLEWNPTHNFQSFTSLFLNKKLWKDLDEESNNHYTGTLSLNIKKHFKCDPETLYKIYDQLTYIQQNFCESFLEIWQNLIPHLIDYEIVDGILILIFTMYEKNMPLLLRFIEVLNFKKFRKECFEPLYYSVLYFVRELNVGKGQACFLKFLLKLVEDFCEELLKEKRNSLSMKDEYEFINTLSRSVDRFLDQNILEETFDELILFCNKAIETSDKKKAEKFLNFFNIITKRIHTCYSKTKFCNQLLIECEKEAFCFLLHDQENFPDWLSHLYSKIPQEMEKLAYKIFQTCSKSRNFNKLRSLLKSIPQIDKYQGLSWVLKFYHSLLQHLHTQMFSSDPFDATKPVVIIFLDFFGVLEEVLDFKVSGDNQIDLDLFIPLLEDILNAGEALHLISSAFPPIPLMNFETLYTVYKELNNPILNDSIIYLRDGGFLRIILKFVFIGLNICQHPRIINVLKIILKGGRSYTNYLTISNEQRQRWDQRFSGGCFEKYTSTFASFRDGNVELIHSVKFLSQYIIAECTEVLVQDTQNPILEFLKEFIRESEALQEIEGKTILNDIILENYYRLLEKNKIMVHSTARSRFPLLDRNRNQDTLSSFLLLQRPDTKNFLNDWKELFSRYRQVKDNSQDLLDLLTSDQWITKVHFFFLASTSMKLNFISSIEGNFNTFTSEHRPEENLEEIQRFYEAKQTIFGKYKRIYEQKLDRSQRMAEKKYREFCKYEKNLALILTGVDSGKFRLKEVNDGMGRMTFIEKKRKKKEHWSQGKARLSLTSPQQVTLLINKSMDETIEDSNFVESEDEESIAVTSNNLEDVKRLNCERIKINESVFGFLELSQDYLLYISEGKEKPKDPFYFGSALDFTIVVKKIEKIWKTSEIAEILPRRFIHRNTAFEVFLKTGKTLYFNVFCEKKRNEALDFLRHSTRKYGKIVKMPSELFQTYKKAWVKGSISNLEYLMMLNKLSSRSFNDISQYPVFPWILKDYSNKELKLEDQNFFRNLAYPIGAQTELSRDEALKKFRNLKDDDMYSFHYGSHYSSAGIVLHYMVRIEPYTDMAKNLQGGCFDVADRLFYSIEAAWESGQGTTGDVKELVPEMFYLPEILVNINKEDLGHRQDTLEVCNVELPPWAKNEIDFIIKHRRALESPYVSSHLNEWIDLIFGYKQLGDHGASFFNLFNSLTYEKYFNKLIESSENKDELQGYVEQVVHFGQTPVQLLKVPHPAKDSKLKALDIIDRWKISNFSPDFEVSKGPGVILSLLSNSQGVWSIQSIKNYLYLVKETALDKVTQIKMDCAKDMKINDWQEAVQWKYNFNSRNLVLIRNSEQYCFWGDEFVVSGFHVDNSFKVHTLKGVMVKSVHHHAGLVTCVTSAGNLLFTGSMDTSIAAWQLISNKDEKIKPLHIYLGHSEAIRQLAVQEKYNILLSLSVNGFALMHEVRSSQCLRKLAFSQPIRLISVSEYGLVAIYLQKIGIKILTINGSELVNHLQKSDIKFLKFSDNGDYLIFGSSIEIAFFDIIDPYKIYERSIDEKREGYEIETFVFSANKEQLFVAFNSEKDSKLWKLK